MIISFSNTIPKTHFLVRIFPSDNLQEFFVGFVILKLGLKKLSHPFDDHETHGGLCQVLKKNMAWWTMIARRLHLIAATLVTQQVFVIPMN